MKAMVMIIGTVQCKCGRSIEWSRYDAVILQASHTGLWGAVWTPSTPGGRWEAKVAVPYYSRAKDRKMRFLGAFETEQEAKKAVERALSRKQH